MQRLESYLQDSGATSWRGVSIADALYSVNGVLSALGRAPLTDRSMSKHLEEHVDFARCTATQTLPELARPPAAQGELLVSVDDGSAAGQLWNALEDLRQVQEIIREQFIGDPAHVSYDRDGNPVGPRRISAKEVQAYVQTVKEMRGMIDSLQRIRSGEHALQVAIRTGTDEAIAEVQIKLLEGLSRISSQMEAQELSGSEASALLKEWLASTSRAGLMALLVEAREAAFRSATRLQGVSDGSVRRGG